MIPHRLTRRRFLQGSVLAGVGAVLAACDPITGGSASGSLPASPRATATGPPSSPGDLRPTGPMTFANWKGYIDLGADGLTSPTLAAFEEQHGVQVDYAPAEIEDNEAFVSTIRQQLEANVEPGWDLVVLSDWMAARFVANGWAEPIDPAHVPTAVRNLGPDMKGEAWDPGQEFHYPWVSFATGIAWHRESIGRDLLSFGELFEPALSGRVTLLRTARDTLPMVHLLLRARGSTSQRRTDEMTVEDAGAAIDFLKPYVDSGHIREFTMSDDVGDLVDGTTAAALARSRDLASLVGPTEGFAYPSEGWLTWSDNLVIPRAAKHRYTAELAIDWVYDPARAARVTAAVLGISPVNGVAAALSEVEGAPDPAGAAWTLLFPPVGVRSRRHRRPTWTEETEAEIDDRFAALTGVPNS